MKAVAVFPGEKDFRVIPDHAEPSITAPAQARIRILDVGICGTDKEIIAFEYGTPPEGSRYLVLGHESLGQVVETGSDVKGLQAVTSPWLWFAGAARIRNAWRAGQGARISAIRAIFVSGIKEEHDLMTEFIVEDAEYVVSLPRELRAVGVLVEPLTIAEKGVAQLWQVQHGLPWMCALDPGKPGAHCHKALVLGAGPGY